MDAFEDAIRGQLALVPTMPATVIAERVGWTRGITVFKERVAELRPAYLPVDPASRTSCVAGDVAQCDLWFPPIQLPVGFGQTEHQGSDDDPSPTEVPRRRPSPASFPCPSGALGWAGVVTTAVSTKWRRCSRCAWKALAFGRDDQD